MALACELPKSESGSKQTIKQTETKQNKQETDKPMEQNSERNLKYEDKLVHTARKRQFYTTIAALEARRMEAKRAVESDYIHFEDTLAAVRAHHLAGIGRFHSSNVE
jgi:hypothetical protein